MKSSINPILQMRIERLKKVQRFVNDILEVSNEPHFKHKSSDFCAFSTIYQAVSISRCFVLVWWIKCKCWLGLQIPQQWLKEGKKGQERGDSFGSKKKKKKENENHDFRLYNKQITIPPK